MKKKILVVLFALALSVNLRSQVTIGGLTTPKAGALLDLNSTTPGGLVLSNVDLTDLSVIPANTFVGISAVQDRNLELEGMIVYNTKATTGIGIHVWDGDDWIKPCAPPAPDSITFSGSSCPITANIDPVPGATSYDWRLPTGLTITGAPDGATITISGVAGTYPTGSISVRAVSSSCGAGTRRASTQDVTLAPPATPGAITFSRTSFCVASTATFTAGIATVAGATSYIWSLPAGLTITSAPDVATITISGVVGNYPAGSISVQAVNSCGAGASSLSTKVVKVSAIPTVPTGGTVSNSGTTFTFGVTPPPAGHEINWYDAVTGGTKVATGASFSKILSRKTTYYAESRNTTTGCVSASRLAVTGVGFYSVSGCDATHSYGGSVITSANVEFVNNNSPTYARHGITLSTPVKIVGKGAKSTLSSTSTSVDYCDHDNTNTYGSGFTWCMVATHADILCPSPWRVPTEGDFCQYANGSSADPRNNGEIKSGIDGWLLGGYTDAGFWGSIGFAGYYWSSTPDGLSDGYAAIVTNNEFGQIVAYRNTGFTLRCVK
jgi:hypothetical protein